MVEGTHAAREVTRQMEIRALRLRDGYESHMSATIFWEEGIRKWDDEWTRDVISGLRYTISHFGGLQKLPLPCWGRKNGT